MQKVCEGPDCGARFDAKRMAARYCSAKCRQRAHRQPNGGKLVALRSVSAKSRPEVAGMLAEATERRLAAAGRLDTELGAAAMVIARRIDSTGLNEAGVGAAALMKEYRATVADALKDVNQESDGAVDDIRASALRLIENLGA